MRCTFFPILSSELFVLSRADWKGASLAFASATKLMQSELINFPEQPHCLSEQFRHCQCPHATSGGSVCASLLAETQAALELLPHGIWSLISRVFLDLNPWLWKGYRDLWKSERVSSQCHHTSVQTPGSWWRWNTTTPDMLTAYRHALSCSTPLQKEEDSW